MVAIKQHLQADREKLTKIRALLVNLDSTECPLFEVTFTQYYVHVHVHRTSLIPRLPSLFSSRKKIGEPGKQNHIVMSQVELLVKLKQREG